MSGPRSCLLSAGTSGLLMLVVLSSDAMTLTSAQWFRSPVRSRFLNKRDLTLSEEPAFYKALGGSFRFGLPTSCQSCAIVGSAGTVKDAGLGWVADASDCVIRLGMSPTNGYEKDVGSKTTLRVLTGDSFNDLFRRPERLVTGDFAADTWVLFHHSGVDLLKAGLKLRQLTRTSNVTVLTVTQAGETDAKRTFKLEADRIGYKQTNSLPSTLWYAVQVATEVGCNRTNVLGVPGPLFCKKHANSYHGRTDSRYWGTSSPPMCSRGKDWGSGPLTSHDRVLSLADRRALKGWAFHNPSKVTFMAPTWSLIES